MIQKHFRRREQREQRGQSFNKGICTRTKDPLGANQREKEGGSWKQGAQETEGIPRGSACRHPGAPGGLIPRT